MESTFMSIPAPTPYAQNLSPSGFTTPSLPYKMEKIGDAYNRTIRAMESTSLGLNQAITEEWDKAQTLMKKNMKLIRQLEKLIDKAPHQHPFESRTFQSLSQPTQKAMQKLETSLKKEYNKHPDSSSLLSSLKELNTQLTVDSYSLAEKMVSIEAQSERLHRIQEKVHPKKSSSFFPSKVKAAHAQSEAKALATVTLTGLITVLALAILL